MNALRSGPKGARFAPFGLAALFAGLAPTSIGYQDLASLIAQQPAVSERWRQHMIASPFGTIHTATFSFPRPVGSAIPEPVRLASLDASLDVTGSIDRAVRPRDDAFPSVDRARKGDFLGRARPIADPDSESEPNAGPVGQAAGNAAIDEIEAAVRFEPFLEYDISLSLELNPRSAPDPAIDSPPAEGPPDISVLASANDPDPSKRTNRLFFGGDPMSAALAAIEPWTPGEEPILMLPRAPAGPDGKRSVLAALPPAGEAAPADSATGPGGETIAGKGEVTGDGQHPKSPAERLSLVGPARAKAEKCLANAIYFESRGEQVRGQIAVAQVVVNRAFSGYYPNDVCGVVYQNAWRHLACQFTFACDGKSKAITEPDAFDRAKRIAAATLDGKIWLPEVGKATHYHAYWVRPGWAREMRKLHTIGVHTFYRPRRWGDGADAPMWGSAAATAETTPKL